MTLLSRFKAYASKVTAVAGSLFGSGYSADKFANEEKVPFRVRVSLPVSAPRYEHIRGVETLLDSRLDLTKDTKKLNSALDDLCLHSDQYVSSLGSKSLSYLHDELSKKAGTIREAYKITDKLGQEANELAGRFERTANSLERSALNYDIDVIESSLTRDTDEVMRSLARIEDRADRYAELLDENKFSDLILSLKNSASSILLAYKDTDTFRPIVDMYKRAALSLSSAKLELNESDDFDPDSDRLGDLIGVK